MNFNLLGGGGVGQTFISVWQARPGVISLSITERGTNKLLSLTVILCSEVKKTPSAFLSTAEKNSYESESSSSSSMVMIVAILVGVLGTVAIGLIIAVVIISRRRNIFGKGGSLIVAEEM